MLQLQNGCSCSEPSVYPNNWMTGGKALLKMNWYIQYYFKDPQFKDKYFQTLEEKRAQLKCWAQANCDPKF